MTIKERPIILNTDEVNAVLAGSKTQHRIVLSSQPYTNKNGWQVLEIDGVRISDQCATTSPLSEAIKKRLPTTNAAPYAIGDLLWVQEKHRPVGWSFEDGEVTIEYQDNTLRSPHYLTDEEFETNPNDDYPFGVVEELLQRGIPLLKDKDCFDFSNPDNLPHWREAEVMPRFASRLTLKIIGVRIEQVKDTSEADALAMGLKPDYCDHKYRTCEEIGCIGKWASALLNDLKSKRKDSEINPESWVWVIEFVKHD